MHDFNSVDVTTDPIKICITLQGPDERESSGSQSHENFVTLQIPGQLNEVVPLTPVQIFVKEEQLVRDQLDVVPLAPVQILYKEEEPVHCKTEEPELVSLVPLLPKEEHVVHCKTEEPVLVSLVPLLPKEEHVVDELPDEFEEGSGRLMINLENSSSEEWSNHSDPLAIEQNVASASYVEYVEASEPVLMELGASSTEGLSHSLRTTRECTSTVENGEVYDLMGSDGVVPVTENGGASSRRDTDGECVVITEVARVPAKVYACGCCGEEFATEGEMQMHTLSHARRAPVWRDVPEAKPKPRPVRVPVPKAQHACGDCGQGFERLEHLMRHRLGHIRAALRKPFSVPKLFSAPRPPGPLKPSDVPEPQVSATPGSRRTARAVPERTSPRRSPQQTTASPQPKRWARRKKTRRRRVS